MRRAYRRVRAPPFPLRRARLASQPLPVVARALTKRFGTVTAVSAIDFDVRPGECVGFLGPNGAGKTTTVRMVSCQSPLTAGSAHVFGLDVQTHPREIKAMLGVCPQDNNADSDFSVRRNLLVFARYYDIERGRRSVASTS